MKLLIKIMEKSFEDKRTHCFVILESNEKNIDPMKHLKLNNLNNK